MDDHYARPSPNTTYASPVDAMLDTPSYNTSEDRDRTYLAYVGKRQVLKRQFGFMSMLGFSCTLMSTWEGLLASFVQGFSNGGPAGLIYGFICCWIGTLCIVACLAEMASMAPTAGGQYHWVAMLAPRPYQRVFSYITGWLTVTGWQAAFASGVFPAATLIQGIIVLNSTNYVPQRWHGTLLFFALVFLAVFINTYISNHLSKLEGLILVLHVLGFFAVLIPLVYLAPQGTASDVFGTFLNEGGWSTQALAFFVGLNTSVYAFAGADGAAHMAEEIHSASTVVPWTMISAVVVNGALGFGILLSVLFSVGDIQQALDTQTGYPFIEIFARAAGLGGGTVMTCVVMVLGIFGTWALLATASRQMWAFARDNGLPFSRFLARIEPRTSLPLYALALTSLISCALALINIGSSAAFAAVISLLVNSFYLSYLIPCFLLCWHRLTGDIKTPRYDVLDTKNVGGGKALYWGPWRMPPLVGIVVNIIACVWGLIVFVFSFWPQETPVTAETMNFSVVVSGFVMMFSLAYYFLRGRKTYVGPVVEIVTRNQYRS